MRTATTTLAAAALLAVGGTAGAALSAGRDRAPVPVAAAPAPVEVRTQVIHRTVHVVRHIKPKRRKPVAAAAPSPARRVTISSAASLSRLESSSLAVEIMRCARVGRIAP